MTQKRMEEQQLNSVSEVIAHAPGIYFQKYGNSADGYHYYISRGDRIDNVNIDGLDASGDGSGYGLSLHNTDSAALLRQHFGKPDDPHGNELPDNPVIIE